MAINGKVCVLSGTGSGVGKATALLFAQHGAKLVMIERNAETQKQTEALLDEMSADYMTVIGETSNEETVIHLMKAAYEKYGKIDFLANIAGIPGYMDHVSTCPTDRFDEIINVNLKSYFLMCKHVFPYLEMNEGWMKKPKGMIVNVASLAGLHGGMGGVSYVTAKHGVVGMSKQIAAFSAKRGVYCNCICPTTIRTPFNDNAKDYSKGCIEDIMAVGMAKNLGDIKAEDMAQVIFVFANDEMPQVNGAMIPVDRGDSAW